VGFRFRRSLKLLPGVKLNLSGGGASISLGTRGFHYTVSSKGSRVTVGIPGTGLSWTEYTPHRTRRQTSRTTFAQEAAPPTVYRQPPLTPIESGSFTQIAARSTSATAPILDSVQRRIAFTPAIFVLCSCILAAARKRLAASKANQKTQRRDLPYATSLSGCHSQSCTKCPMAWLTIRSVPSLTKARSAGGTNSWLRSIA
jgi:hypothetical protein